MTDIVACLSTGKGTWGPVIKLINSEEFDKAYIITNEFGQENFNAPDNCELIVIDNRAEEKQIKENVKQALDEKINDTEVALNMTSGSGREHMALLCALLELGLGIRMVVPGDDGFEEL